MWWNILPSWIITGSLISFPVYFTAGLSYAYCGSAYNRERCNPYFAYLILRDEAVLDGADPYKQLRPDAGLGKVNID
ncbi:hypothetical protein ONE63_000418 [Megalurothrips usitatus]|uniref:Transmembrane protein n=1 Tax=Megalurothrips usitatus TaxID=439358 RepID=A0AAV7Y565_9NEOP|nr:hypothetical protein ONE63_000418 [Megalurothrips usitatus]